MRRRWAIRGKSCITAQNPQAGSPVIGTEVMKFGIIVPTYNRPELVLQAYQSAFDQTYTSWEFHICNDGSTVDYGIVENNLNDPRVFYTRTPENHGCNYARNVAIEKAIQNQCDYLIFMDDEEKLDPRCLEMALEKIKAHPDVGWFISNTYGERKKSTRDIVEEGYCNWIDDYLYGGKLRGDKTHVISIPVMGDLRLDGRFRISNTWRFRLKLNQRTPIWGYPYPSKWIQYSEGGITKTPSRNPRTWLELYSRFARHGLAISIRPTKRVAYKYLVLELLKTPKRALYIVTGKAKRKPAKQQTH
jgi:glycosyltransferase involved in cell wall biosynthesis